jgi:hypothetical protein
MSSHQITEMTYYPTGMWEEEERLDKQEFVVKVSYRGRGKWMVSTRSGFQVLSRAGNWAFDPPKFKRHQYRFDSLEDAQGWAETVVDTIEVNGKTYQQWTEHWARVRDERNEKSNADQDQAGAAD